VKGWGGCNFIGVRIQLLFRMATTHEADKEKIYQSRMVSNAAIAQRDVTGVAQYWMEDIVVISGEGGKFVGKKDLVKIWKQMLDQGTPLFERIPIEIKVGEGGTLAWESGQWNYLDGNAGGNYAAMWYKIKGVWMTRSELFVSLD
jgi:ketosteroid isomerase-like protein